MTAPAIIATTASSQFSGLFPGSNATNRTFSSYWVAGAATGWLRVQLASAYVSTGYRILSNYNEASRAPKSWTFEGSNDGSTWDVLDTQTDVPTWQGANAFELRAYDIANSTAYEYYRLNVSANHGNTYLALAEFYPDAAPVDPGADPYPAEVMADSPTVYIRGSETAGSIAEDVSGNGFQAAMAGTYTRDGASLLTVADPSITFTAGHGRIPTASALNDTSAITLEALVHITSVGALRTIWNRDDESGSRCWQFRVTATGALEFLWWNTSGGGPYFVTSAASQIAADTTYHLAVTYDGSVARLYKDGTQIASTAQAGTIRATSPDARAVYFGSTRTFGQPLVGRGDEFAYYSGVALSAARIAAHAAAVTALAGPPSGAGTGQWGWAGSGASSADPGGSGAGVWGWAGSGVGAAPELVPVGSGAGVWGWAGSGSGSKDPAGSGAGVWGWAGSGTGSEGLPTDIPSGSGVGRWGWSGSGIGVTMRPEHDFAPFRAGARIGYLMIPTAQPPPAGIDPVPVVRMSHVAPAPTEANPIITEGVDYSLAAPVSAGVEHVFVGGVDVTYLGGAPIQNVRRSATSPAGDVAATFEIPAMQAWDKPGEGGYSMLRPDAPVDVALVHDDDTRTHLWSGFLSADAAEVAQGKRNGFTADGTLWQAGYTLHEPPHYLPLTDIGVLIPRALNSVPNKRWSDIPEVTTGILSRDRGASNQSVMQYVMDLLGKAWTADGRQWTLVEVAPREFRVQLKPLMNTADATVTYGAKGIEVNLSREQSTRVDVIYGKGVTAAGGQWRGTRFPGLVLATPPPYPNSDASSLHLGDTDADTDSGTGVSDMQRRLVELGYSLRVDGVLNSNDIDVIRRLQSRMGLLVDGVPGPQTWSGIFNRGPADIDLTQWREPIAAQPWALEHLRDPNGVILGPNPAHDGARIVHAIEVDFGTNITWQQAQPIAERMLAVEAEPALTGTIRLRTDPHEVWRGVIKPGWRVKVLGFQGEDVIVRVAAVDVDTDRDGMVVTLTVDERARDAMSVAAVLERNRAALPDPARKPGNPQRDSRITRDRYVQWDIDSPCGFFPRTAVFGGLWVAPNPIPFSEVGRFVKAVFSSTVTHALMLFGLPVKPSQMHAIVGNPLATTDPYRPHTEALTRLGWIEAWGEQGQRLGYWPGDEGSGYAFSGRTELIGSVDYVSGYGVWIWPLIFSNTTGFVGGGSGDWVSRFYPATDT